MSNFISIKDGLPDDEQHVRTKDLKGREFNCIYRESLNVFHIAGYVWDHLDASEWMPIPDAYNGKPNKW